MHFEDQGTSSGIGNLFGENNAAQLAAQRAMIQRAQALQQAQLSPAQSGTFMATQAGNMFGNAIGSFARPDPRQLKLAQIQQAVEKEVLDAGITDTEKFLRIAASHLIKGGEYPLAVRASKEADALASTSSKRKFTEAQTEKEASEAAKNRQGVSEAQAKQPYEIKLAEMKASATDPTSRKIIAEADKMIKDTEWTDRKVGAEIDKLYAEANKLNAEAGTAKTKLDRESLNEQVARLIEFTRLKEAKGEPIHPADLQAIDRITRILAQAPQPTVTSAIAKSMIAEQDAAKPSPIPTNPVKQSATGHIKDAQGFVVIPEGKPIPKDLPIGTKIRQGNRTGTIK